MSEVKEKDSKILNIRLTEKEHTIIKVKAAQKKMSIKKYLISLVENDCLENEEDKKEE
jgi:predicted DNA binding CopG/RHH family protein